MKKGPRWELELTTAVLALLCLGLAVLAGWQQPWHLLGAAALLAVVVLVVWLRGRSLRRRIGRYLSGEVFEGSDAQFTLAGLPTPALLLSRKTLIWYNEPFRAQFLGGEDRLLQPVNRVLPGLDLTQCQAAQGQVLTAAGGRWQVFAGGEREGLIFLTLTDITRLSKEAEEYWATRPVCLLFEVDGYDTVTGDMKESERARMMEQVNRLLENTIGRYTGFLCRISTCRYIALIEERNLQDLQDRRFDVLDKMRQLDDNMGLTLSIGVGRGGASLAECQEWARQSLDMALGRGGDQAAMKTEEGFSFYGGVSRSIEKQSKVRSRIVAGALTELIRNSDSVLIMGHKMSDLDSVGSALGVLHICQTCQVPAAVVLRRGATLAGSLIREFDKAGLEDSFIEPEKVLEAITPDTLLVVVDTCLKHRLESLEVYQQCRHVAVIDHHRRAVGAIDNAVIWYQEPYASSASELVSEMLQYVGDKNDRPTQLEAEALLAGIMLDTRNFGLHTGVRTFEAAAYLRRLGASTEDVKALFASTMEEYAVKAKLVESAKLYMGCAISLSGELPPASAVAVPQAANDLLTIEGVEASFVAVQQGPNVNVSGRSMGAVNVQVILETLGGGGHLTMAGAQLRDTTVEEVGRRLRDAIQEYRAEQSAQPVAPAKGR